MGFPQEVPSGCSLEGSNYCFNQFGSLRQNVHEQGKKIEKFENKFDDFVTRYNADQLKLAEEKGRVDGAGKTKQHLTTMGMSVVSSAGFLAFLKAIGIRFGN